MKWLYTLLFSIPLMACQAENMNDSVDLSTLIDSKWLLEDLNGHGVIDMARTTLEIKKDNQLGGSGGCNVFFSSYTQTGDNLEIGPVAATKKFCVGGLMDQENKYFLALSKVEKVYYDEHKRLLMDINGEEKPLVFTKMTKQ